MLDNGVVRQATSERQAQTCIMPAGKPGEQIGDRVRFAGKVVGWELNRGKRNGATEPATIHGRFVDDFNGQYCEGEPLRGEELGARTSAGSKKLRRSRGGEQCLSVAKAASVFNAARQAVPSTT